MVMRKRTGHSTERLPASRAEALDGSVEEESDQVSDEDAPVRAPWHFKVLLVGTVGYLVYRLIWFIEWLQHH